MGRLWDLLTVAAIAIWIVGLAAQGVIDVQLAGIALAALVVIAAIGRGIGREVGHAVRLLLRVGLPIASIATFVVIFGSGDAEEMTAILTQLLVLFVVLVGLYIMVSGPFRRRG